MTKKYYKAFDSNLQCRGFQYEVGKEYMHDGEIHICEAGFHSCENPFDVLNYYNLTESRFCEVKVGADLKTHNTDSKIVSSKITIECEINLNSFVKSCIDYVTNLCSKNKDLGCYSQLAASGDKSIVMISGCDGKAKVGKDGVIALTWWNEKEERYRVSLGYEGEKGIEPDIWYQMDDSGNFVKCKE